MTAMLERRGLDVVVPTLRRGLVALLLLVAACSNDPEAKIVAEGPSDASSPTEQANDPDPATYPCLVEPTPSDCSAFEVESSRKIFDAGGLQAEVPDDAAPVDLEEASATVLSGGAVVRADRVLKVSCTWAELNPDMPGSGPRYDVEPTDLVHVISVNGEIQRLHGPDSGQPDNWLVVTVSASTGQTLSVDAGAMEPPGWSSAPCT